MNVVSTFGRVLAEQRKKRGMSRSQLAESAQFSYPYVSQLETGLRKPSRDAAARLSRALGISLLDLEAAIPTNESEEEIGRANRESERILSRLESGDIASPMAAGVMALRPRCALLPSIGTTWSASSSTSSRSSRPTNGSTSLPKFRSA